ncbi:carboxypeptidase regulatory-like domain-containing protein [Rhodoferax sp. AJA081-3]|uniref:carboxypeptidase regulatory-like domain-containing protein n=1 Tax=Rhodoferax sp. AJA081-3 TaxID=2752316 RepID=UPI001ADF5042|nr:carboxypeptidase regulatory-like domain-containing protein [Rhodoferax sp. AJA081-3]QTN27476.1 carboxypeptidase regulatory-like domain-containing protein [Rhodoferax sp. AJA081-3]
MATAQAQVTPEVTNGLAWLDAQVLQDGQMVADSQIATAQQARCETATTLLKFLGSTLKNSALVATLNQSGAEVPTQNLACQQQLRQQLGQVLLAPEIELRRIGGEGFGAYEGYAVPNALDSGWASLPQLQNLTPQDKSRLLAWFQANQAVDGHFALHSGADLLATAAVLRGLKGEASLNPVAAAIASKAAAYLLGRRNAAGHWSDDTASTALIFEAVHPYTGGDPTIATGVASYLLGKQQQNGSWDADPFTTAVALRALGLSAQPALNPTLAVLRVRFVDASNNAPLPGVVLVSPSAPTVNGTSNALGQIELGALLPGSYQLQASLNGYATLNFTVSLTAGQVLDAGVLQMLVAGNTSLSVVTGQVRDQSNNAPLDGAIVSVSPQNLTAVTTADGRYLISGVTPGNITVSVDKTGFASAAGSGTVLAGQVLNFSPLLVPSSAPGQAGDCSVQGLITDAISHAPLAGVTVNLGGVVTRTTVTDAQGRYSLPALASGVVTVSTAKAGYDSVNASTRLVCSVDRATVVDFSPRLYATGQTPPNANTSGLSGVVMDARTNQPIANAALLVTPEVGAPVNALSAADGTFSIAGLNGASVQLSVTATGYQGIALQFALTPLTVTDLGQIRLRPPTVQQLLPDFKVMVVKRGNALSDPQTLQLSGTVEVDVSNVGTQSTPAGATVLAFNDVNRDDAFDTAVDVVLGQTTLATALPPGQTTTVQIDVGGTLAFRDAPIHVIIDPAQQIPEISKANNVRSTSQEALYTPVAQNFNPALKWAWSGSTNNPQYNQVMMTPVVGQFVDTNGDGVVDTRDNPCVIFTAFAGSSYAGSGVIRVLDGVTGNELMSIVDSQNGVSGSGGLALADLDGDGRPELIAITRNVKAVVFKNDGSRLWTSEVLGPMPPYGVWSAPSVADLDGDGSPEIMIQRAVLNANGTIKWTTSGSSYGANTTIVSDLFDAGQQNVIQGGSVYTAGGTLIWQGNDGFSGVADFEGAGRPSIAVVGGGFVHLYSREGVLKWRVAVPGGGGGPPTIADADGDGVPDIGVAGRSAYTVFRADGSVMWSKSAQDYSSAITGSTFFDFDGSGSATALYADEKNMRGFKGSTGQAVWSIPNPSDTYVEYPVVVDIDRDGHADLVVVANNHAHPGVRGIRVFQDVNNAWVPTRSIWNQHAYSINNINDDLTVPRRPVPSWKSHNTFRLNKRMDADARAIADLTVGYLRVADAGAGGGSTLTVRVGNAGSYLIPVGTKLAVYNTNPSLGQPVPSARLGIASTSQALQPGEWQDVAIPVTGNLATLSAGNTIWIVGDDDGTGKKTIADFDRSNNTLMGDLSAIALNLKIAVSTNLAVYTERDQAIFTGTVSNQGSFARDAIVRYTVLDAHGRAVQTLPVGNAVGVAAAASVTVPALWATVGTLAGNYQVRAELVTPLGVVYGSATANFAIQAGQPQFNSARVTTDRSSYTSAQTVQLTARVSNLTSNLVQADLRARTTVLSSTGASAFSQTEAIAQLVAGGQRQFTYNLPAAGLAAGSYNTQLQLLDAQGNVLAQHTGVFTVQPADQNGVGLSGSIQANPATTAAGGTVALSASVRNLGNAAISNAALTVSIVDPIAQRTIASWPYNPSIAQGASFAMTPVWNTTGSVPNTYVAVLSTTLGGSSQTLASTNIVVTAAGSSTKPRVGQYPLRQGRVLLLVSCRNREDGYADQGTVPVAIPDGPGADDARCTASRTAFVKRLLTTAGVPHYVTSNVDDFTYALRSGQFNIYWISGGADKLTDGLALEIREAVNRGDGLLIDGIHDARNKLLDEVVGVGYRGQVLVVNQPITFANGPLVGSTLQTTGRALTYNKGTAIQVAKFPAGVVCANCNAADDTAVAGNTYGRGKGVVMAFDLIGSLQSHIADPKWNTALQQAFEYLLPQVADPLTAGAYAAVRTTVGYQGAMANFNVAYTVPTGAKALAGEPVVTILNGAPQAQWDFSLANGQSKDFTLYLRAPTSNGTHFLGTAVNLMVGGQISLAGSYPFALQVAVASDAAATSKLIADLNALSFTVASDGLNRSQAVRYLQSAVAQTRPELAITNLISAVDTLRLITSKDMSAYRLQIDRWMQELAYQWQTAQPVRNIP